MNHRPWVPTRHVNQARDQILDKYQPKQNVISLSGNSESKIEY